MTAWLLVPVLRRRRTRRPDVQLDLTEFTSADRMVEHLMADGTDLVVGPEPTTTSAYVEVLGREKTVVVASPGHPFADRESVAVQDIAGEPFVHYDPENGMGVWIDQLVAARQTALTVVLRTHSPRIAAQLAGAGMGVTIVAVSALAGRPSVVVRRAEPRVHRDILALTMVPSDALVRRFVADLPSRGLPRVNTAAGDRSAEVVLRRAEPRRLPGGCRRCYPAAPSRVRW
ncbi:LysR family transcriptional regulator substrate-binding protein [Streptomyces sp. NPDC005202]|uniref:LysR family transcriptional regulator substrate-binding protein n=1 Tax=Streptomyces sp. NPDC005202 TaxID=3157021 RepID=UPI0033A1BCF5